MSELVRTNICNAKTVLDQCICLTLVILDELDALTTLLVS